MTDAFERIEWRPGGLVLDGFEYRFEKGATDSPDEAQGFFRLYKSTPLLEQYHRFWKLHADFEVSNLFEIGLWDGGSLAFWNDVLKPQRHVAIDLLEHTDSAYFQEFVRQRGRQDSIRALWETDQANRTALHEIVQTHFEGPLDLVLDDGSHLYEATRTSFEALFPLLRLGGFYIIEDWAWAHWRKSHEPTNDLFWQTPLTELVVDLIEATGTNLEPIRSVSVYQGFTAIEKGILSDSSTPFRLEDHILRRPTPPPVSLARRAARRLRALVRPQ